MKAEELRVGNMYMSVKFGVPVKCELTDFTQLDKMSDGAYNDPPIDEMFKPIPLTEQWLENLGFYEKYKSVHSHWNLKGFGLDQKSNVDDNNNTIPTEEVFYYDYKYEIKYVHQLQNLYFALTGEELTQLISNPK